MNDFKIEITCETPLSYKEISNISFDIVASIEEAVKGQVGDLTWRKIDEYGNDGNVYIGVLPKDDKASFMNEDKERFVLTIDMDDIEEAIEAQDLGGFFKNHPKAKQDALECAFYRVTRYIDKNDFLREIVLNAVYDTAKGRC